jgi:Protein of unknown function (DUF2971)
MTDPKQDASPEPSLPPVLRTAIDRFDQWVKKHLASEQKKNAIDTPLYHYTDGRGLKGIIESQTIWFTDFRHLNDTSELIHGIEMAHEVMRLKATGADARAQVFLDCLADMLSSENFLGRLEFFISGFSRDRDDLGQWRAYADNGRGYAIGFAPRVFRIEDKPDPRPDEKVFVGPVLYNIGEVMERHGLAIDKAVTIFLETAEASADLVANEAVGEPFMQELVRSTIASPLIWNCLTSKDPAYEHEKEVRLIILGQRNNLMPYITTRMRGSEIVPYIAHPRPIREPHNIVEIVVGPAAGADAERSVRTMLDSFGVDPNVLVSRSDIPYRAF